MRIVLHLALYPWKLGLEQRHRIDVDDVTQGPQTPEPNKAIMNESLASNKAIMNGSLASNKAIMNGSLASNKAIMNGSLASNKAIMNGIGLHNVYSGFETCFAPST